MWARLERGISVSWLPEQAPLSAQIPVGLPSVDAARRRGHFWAVARRRPGTCGWPLPVGWTERRQPLSPRVTIKWLCIDMEPASPSAGPTNGGATQERRRASGARRRRPAPKECSAESTKLAMSVKEAALTLGISTTLAYELVRRGEFPCIRLGRRIVVSHKALKALVDGAT